MIRLIAKQSQMTSSRTIIQKTYRFGDEYKTVSEVWIPKVSWFRPPCIGIFRWAYRIRFSISNKLKDVATFVDDKGRVTQVGAIFTERGNGGC